MSAIPSVHTGMQISEYEYDVKEQIEGNPGGLNCEKIGPDVCGEIASYVPPNEWGELSTVNKLFNQGISRRRTVLWNTLKKHPLVTTVIKQFDSFPKDGTAKEKLNYLRDTIPASAKESPDSLKFYGQIFPFKAWDRWFLLACAKHETASINEIPIELIDLDLIDRCVVDAISRAGEKNYQFITEYFIDRFASQIKDRSREKYLHASIEKEKKPFFEYFLGNFNDLDLSSALKKAALAEDEHFIKEILKKEGRYGKAFRLRCILHANLEVEGAAPGLHEALISAALRPSSDSRTKIMNSILDQSIPLDALYQAKVVAMKKGERFLLEQIDGAIRENYGPECVNITPDWVVRQGREPIFASPTHWIGDDRMLQPPMPQDAPALPPIAAWPAPIRRSAFSNIWQNFSNHISNLPTTNKLALKSILITASIILVLEQLHKHNICQTWQNIEPACSFVAEADSHISRFVTETMTNLGNNTKHMVASLENSMGFLQSPLEMLFALGFVFFTLAVLKH